MTRDVPRRLVAVKFRRHWRVWVVVLGCLWFGSIVLWASQVFVDEVPVGTDYTLDPPARVSVDVECHPPLSSTAGSSEPLPALPVQPDGQPPLAYTREPCAAQRDSVRKALVIDAVVLVGVIAGVIVVSRRQRAAPERVTSAADESTAVGPA